MTQPSEREIAPNRRILIVDDNPPIHEDFKKVLGAPASDESAFHSAESALFGEESTARAEAPLQFEIDSALQGQEANERVIRALREGRPFAVAFVDMRMPPGWDGVETIRHLWEADPDLQVVVCTAYADYSWSQMIARLGRSDRLLILKKPFDAIEVCQLASALTEKWNIGRREQLRLQEVKRAEQEARAYAASLETVNRALETAKAAAEAAAQSRSEFLSRMASEVLTPLANLVAGSGQVLTLDEKDEQWCARLEELCRQGGELCSTLEDVRELSAIDAGQLQMAPASCSPSEIVRRILDEARPAAEAKGLALELARGAGVPEMITTDAERLRRVLAHLVENAVRFTASGSVKVELAARGEDWQGPLLEIAVLDTGPGLTREQQTRLFEPFCALPVGDAALPRSAGLGLSLCKRLARLLGGDLRVESTPGQGSRFSLSLRA